MARVEVECQGCRTRGGETDADPWTQLVCGGDQSRVCGVLGTEVAANAALMSMGLDSIAAVEFASAVGEAVRSVGSFSAIMLFDHPTVDSITSYLARLAGDMFSRGRTGALSGVDDDGAGYAVCGERKKRGAEEGRARISIAAMRFQLAGPTRSESGLRRLVTRGDATSSGIPTARWSSTVVGDAVAASRYGSFVSLEDLELESRAFGISAAEAESMDPQQVFVLHVGYGALVSGAGCGEAEQVRRAWCTLRWVCLWAWSRAGW